MNSRILTETFNNILTSQINAERASIRVHSTLDVLKAYFLNHSPIEVILEIHFYFNFYLNFFKIHLCANESLLLGKTSLNIGSIMKKENFDLNSKPIIIDEVLRLQSINEKQAQLQNNDDIPIIGVQVILRKENFPIEGLVLNGEPKPQTINTNESKFSTSNRHDESTPKKAEKTVTPNVTPIKSNTTINDDDDDENHRNDDDRFLRTPSPVTIQQTTITKHVNQLTTSSAAAPSSTRYHFENSDKPNHKPQKPINNENFYNEELQLRAAYEIQLWKEAREKEFDQYVCF